MSLLGTTGFREELVHALAQSPLLRMLGKGGAFAEELRGLLDEARLKSFKSGESVIQEGSEADGIYILIEGKVDVYKGTKQVGTLSQVGEVFGEVGVIAGCLRTATVKASGSVTCLHTGSTLRRRFSDQENLVFTQAMQQALSQIFLRRLQAVNEEVVALRGQLDLRDKEILDLQQKNQFLEHRVEGLVKERSEGFHGTRARWKKEE